MAAVSARSSSHDRDMRDEFESEQELDHHDEQQERNRARCCAQGDDAVTQHLTRRARELDTDGTGRHVPADA